MRDLPQDSWPAERAGARWPLQPGPRHPLAVGALCVALAVGAWYGALWRLGQPGEAGASVPGRVVPAQAADTQSGRETRRVVVPPRTTSSPPSAPAAPRVSPKPSTSKVLSDSPSNIVSASAPTASGDSASKASRDSAPQSKLSPFRRAHPWAAPAGGRYYYPSSCPATLRLPDLVFFRSEAEARERGFIPSGRPGCE